MFVGLEPLVLEGMEAGAAGAVSGLATAFPETVANAGARSERAPPTTRSCSLRDGLQGIPFHAAMKELLVEARGATSTPTCGRRCAASPTTSERGARARHAILVGLA